jgi:hypothetical protein
MALIEECRALQKSSHEQYYDNIINKLKERITHAKNPFVVGYRLRIYLEAKDTIIQRLVDGGLCVDEHQAVINTLSGKMVDLDIRIPNEI